MDGVVPAEKYMFKVFPALDETISVEELPWQRVDQGDHDDVELLLRWVFDFYHMKVADSTVQQHEFLRFVILEHKLEKDPWLCELHVFEIESQKQWTLWFKLA